MKKYLHGIICLLITCNAVGQSPMPNVIEHYLQQYHATRQYSGVFQWNKEGKQVYTYALGWKDFKEGKALSGREVFGIGSITKLFTALLVMQEVEQGTLRLEDRIGTWITADKLPVSNDITIRQLLQHTSGLGNYMQHPKYGQLMLSGAIRSIDDLLPLIAEVPVRGQAGIYQYSNSGYILLGKVLENLTAKPFHQLVEERVLRPLQMENSFTSLARTSASMAQPYRFVGKENLVHYAYPDTLRSFPDGGLMMNAGDLALFGQALLQNSLVKAATWQQMISDTVRVNAQTWQGLGVLLESIEGKLWMGHDGFSRGYSVDLKLNVTHQMVLVSMLNNNGLSSVQINQSIIRMMEGRQPPPPKPYLWQVICEQLRQSPSVTLDELNGFLKEKGYRPLASAMQVIGLTNDLAEAGLDAASMQLLQLNLRLFPGEGAGYKALGEAYVEQDRKEEAIACFRKALELHPGDAYAKKRLVELEER